MQLYRRKKHLTIFMEKNLLFNTVHSERSEESQSPEILHCVQDDRLRITYSSVPVVSRFRESILRVLSLFRIFGQQFR